MIPHPTIDLQALGIGVRKGALIYRQSRASPLRLEQSSSWTSLPWLQWGVLPMKTFLAIVAAAFLAIGITSLINPQEASAQQPGGRGGRGGAVDCPQNTCNPKGGPKAKNASLCSAANCKAGGVLSRAKSIRR